MKPSAKVGCLLITGSVFMMLGVFARPLGIPSRLESLPMLVGVVFTYLGYRAGKKAKEAGQIPALSDSQKRKQFVLLVAVCAAACIFMPFVMPIAGLALPLTELVIISIVSFVLCVGALWLGMKMRA